MRIRQADTPFKLPGSDSPLKKSTSVTAIIHGNDSRPNNIYYVDCSICHYQALQRFKRDYASVDKSDRDDKRQKIDELREKRRMQTIDRQLNFKRIDDNNLQKLRDRQSNSLYLHKMGGKMTIHSHGVPIDPVNQFYQNTEKGKYQQRYDQEKRINNLVRSHHLQTCGTSGYNIINGQASIPVQKMMQPQQLPMFQQKLSQYYQKFRIRPQ